EGDVVWIGGYYHWDDDRNDFLWVSGCWRTKPPGREWVPGYWREQGEQWQWVPGFWTEPAPQQAVAKEVVYQPEPPAPPAVAPPGMLYAPVVVDTVVVGPRFVYTPVYAVSDAVVLDAMFVRPACCHYYFGDYYGDCYRDRGFVSCVVYSRTHYEPIVVYRT